MKILVVLFSLYYVFNSVESYKVLVYTPLLGHSHVKFMGSIADTLAEAGHDVTILMPLLELKNGNKTGVTLVKKVILYPGDKRSVELTNKVGGTQEESGEFNIWKSTPSSSMMEMLGMTADIFKFQCQKMMNDKELLDKLRAEEFDLGIAEPLGICQFVLFDELQIPATIAAESTAPMPMISRIIGEPQLVSNVPTIFAEFGDKMTLAQRAMNLAVSLFGFYFANFIFTKELDSIENVVGKKEYAELISRASYVFVNSHPYLDFPFPALPKTVLIGGITVSPKSKNSELSEKWQEILSRRSKNVLISFGSNVRSMDMPEEYRQSFFQMFESMPDTTFIWKFEKKNATIADAYDNVVLTKWMPQTELLADPRLTMFITHGGLGSSMELAHSGKPAVVVPVTGDQKRNAEMLLRHEVALSLQKEDLENADKLINTVREVIDNDKYRKKAERLAEILKSRLTSSKEMVIKHAEFAAKFGKLPELDSYGRHLNVFQYYLIDVMALLVAIIIVILIILKFVFKLIKKFCCSRKEKKE